MPTTARETVSKNKLQGEVALVTGASRGIGRSIALALAEQGVHVALLARSAEALKAVAAACAGFGVRTMPLVCDVQDRGAIARAVSAAHQELGGISYLINNAGILDYSHVADADMPTWDTLMEVNVRALVHLTHHALPFIKRAKERGVINICSVAGRSSRKGGAIYGASKHAVLGFTESVFEDVREDGIKVCAICPGYVATDMIADVKLAHDKCITADDVARCVLYVLQQDNTVCPTEIVLRPQRSPEG